MSNKKKKIHSLNFIKTKMKISDLKPNIVLIIADQWRGDCIGFLNHPVVETPNIDCLFSQGVAFTQAYSAVPSCIAARTTLLTGLSQKSHGRVGYQDRVRWNYPVTLPGLLSEAGYHTHCVGKMHVFPARKLMGFHSVTLHDGYLHNERCRETDYNLVDDYLPWLKEKCGSETDITDAGLGCNGYSVNPWPYEERYHPTNWVTSQSIDFLRKRDPTKPFFLKVSYHRPHPPLDPPEYYLNRYLDKELPPVAIGDWVENSLIHNRGIDCPVPKDKSQIDLARKAYYAQLTHIDCQINRIVHALNEQQLMENTLLMFVSDHGDMLFDHNMVAKSVPYNGSSKIPFLLRFPDSMRQPKITKVDVPVELRDILPTFLEAAGIDIPDSIEGSSVLPLCYKKNSEWREYIHGEHSYGKDSNHWITNGKEMYIWFSQTGKEQFFEIEKDPDNLINMLEKKNNRVIYWRQKLINELKGREENYVKNGKLITGQIPKTNLNQNGK